MKVPLKCEISPVIFDNFAHIDISSNIIQHENVYLFDPYSSSQSKSHNFEKSCISYKLSVFHDFAQILFILPLIHIWVLYKRVLTCQHTNWYLHTYLTFFKLNVIFKAICAIRTKFHGRRLKTTDFLTENYFSFVVDSGLLYYWFLHVNLFAQYWCFIFSTNWNKLLIIILLYQWLL